MNGSSEGTERRQVSDDISLLNDILIQSFPSSFSLTCRYISNCEATFLSGSVYLRAVISCKPSCTLWVHLDAQPLAELLASEDADADDAAGWERDSMFSDYIL
jgi:hypothetical protein